MISDINLKNTKFNVIPKVLIQNMENKKSNTHLFINDAGIGSNRIEMTNNYLNTFNYYHKNMIKMHRIREIENFERKEKFYKFRKDIEIPGLMFTNAYYKYTGNDFEYFENDKNNTIFKNAKINYLQDLKSNEKKNNSKLSKTKNNNDKDNIHKNLKKTSELLININNEKRRIFVYNYTKNYNHNKISKINNHKQRNETLSNDQDDDFLKYKSIKNKTIKCRIMFGKSLNNDLKIKNKEKNNGRNFSYNKNDVYQSLDVNNYQKYSKYNQSKDIKMKLLNKNKMLPLIK